ncbi:hypothetical protein L5515_016943 [Caenorhabditis briggsae]|uniref:von Hippel-Lindau disease tumour suppressor beta domain-containing protein n=1 Tax=Caenorhabditis briggsae TaxID=6238 RepID=A0AAE9FI99_CAEBR|nr:hypothetical protein L5515_016943 [Caenorhabditis briggsae]
MSAQPVDDDGKLFPDVGSNTRDNVEIRVRFVNKCPYPVDVFWLNRNKQPTKYGTLGQKQYLDIKTYRNHPWVARRTFDGCKVLVNKKFIFWPEPTAHKNIIVRTFCEITARVQSLREMASRSFLKQDPKHVDEQLSSLPRDVQFEVKDLLAEKREYNEFNCRDFQPPPQA